MNYFMREVGGGSPELIDVEASSKCNKMSVFLLLW